MNVKTQYTDEIKNDLPEHLIHSLENGDYGREYLEELDSHLMSRI